jgi:hypothetical protein
MLRRTLLRFLAASFASPLTRLGLRAQSTTDLTEANVAALAALAEVTLPSALGAEGRTQVVRRFVTWVRNYREGADMGHGYGSSNLRRPSGPSPAGRYPGQFAALDAAADAEGAASFAGLPPDRRRAVVLRMLNEPQPVTRLPGSPTGDNLVADFMGFYFNGPDAWDLCYQAAIGAERCRPLAGSEARPAPLGRS